jgi:hypothetical protein
VTAPGNAFDQWCRHARETWPEVIKVQAAGPWTLTSELELHSGHKVLTDL